MAKLKCEVSNRLPFPFNDVKLMLVIKAESRMEAIAAAAEFGKKHGVLLTY